MSHQANSNSNHDPLRVLKAEVYVACPMEYEYVDEELLKPFFESMFGLSELFDMTEGEIYAVAHSRPAFFTIENGPPLPEVIFTRPYSLEEPGEEELDPVQVEKWCEEATKLLKEKAEQDITRATVIQAMHSMSLDQLRHVVLMVFSGYTFSQAFASAHERFDGETDFSNNSD